MATATKKTIEKKTAGKATATGKAKAPAKKTVKVPAPAKPALPEFVSITGDELRELPAFSALSTGDANVFLKTLAKMGIAHETTETRSLSNKQGTFFKVYNIRPEFSLKIDGSKAMDARTVELAKIPLAQRPDRKPRYNTGRGRPKMVLFGGAPHYPKQDIKTRLHVPEAIPVNLCMYHESKAITRVIPAIA